MPGFAHKLKLLWLKAGGGARRQGRPNDFQRRRSARISGPRWAEHDTDEGLGGTQPGHEQTRQQDTQRRSVTPYYVWGTLALLAVAFSFGTIYWHQKQKVLESTENAPAYGDPLLQLDEGAKTALLNQSPELDAKLKRGFLGKPDQLCAELHALGLENQGWNKAPFQRGRWQCASDLVPLTTPSVDFGSTTLFFLLRGPSEEKIDYLRLKLAVEDARQKEIGQEAVWLVIDALAARYGWTVPDGFREAIADFKQLETTYRGVQLSVAPEDPNLTGDPLANQRLNIILNFGEPDLIRPADRFEVAPPLESGWSKTDDPKDRGDQGAE
ncbi:MAG: DUF6030 family protein [Pseudomonadota bacterium]